MAKLSAEKRSRWSAEQAREVLREQERSGLSVQAFAARAGLEAERLYRWRRKFCEETKSVEFIEVRAEAEAAPLEVVLRGGHRLLIRGSVDIGTLAAIVTTLEREC